MTGACSLCGAVGPVHWHHLTGRPAPDERYFDTRLVIALCLSCHASVHQVLRVVGLDFPAPSSAGLSHRLLRVAVTAELVASAGRPLALSPGSAQGLAGLLRDGAGLLDCAGVAS